MTTQFVISFLVLELVVQFVSTSPTERFQAFKNCLLENSIEPTAIISSSSSDYSNLNYRWQLRNRRSEPLAFVLPQSEFDVGFIVACGTEWKIRLVPKTGGHSFESYSFGDNNSVIVDMRRMNWISVDKIASQVNIGAGALTGPIALTLWNRAKSLIPFGTCATVGIAGLSTGGGVGYFSRTFGLTLDRIVSMTIVTADGRRVTANLRQNPNLYWALRGGGAASFGIVTRFVFATYPAPHVVYLAKATWRLSSFVSVLTAWQALLLNSTLSVNPNLLITNSQLELSVLDTTGTSTNFEITLGSFPSPIFKQGQVMTYPKALLYLARDNLKEVLGANLDPQILLTLNTTSSLPIFEKAKSFYIEKIAKKSDLQNLFQLCQTMPPTMNVAVLAGGGAINKLEPSETAYVHRSGRLALATARVDANPDNPYEYRTVEREWTRKFIEFGQVFLGGKESYQNYVDADLPDYLKRYYGENLGKLVQVKKLYDSENYFNNPQSIPLSLS